VRDYAGAQVTFEPGEDGRAARLILHQNGADQIAERIDRHSADDGVAIYGQTVLNRSKNRFSALAAVQGVR
jgi:hypothetical protein